MRMYFDRIFIHEFHYFCWCQTNVNKESTHALLTNLFLIVDDEFIKRRQKQPNLSSHGIYVAPDDQDLVFGDALIYNSGLLRRSFWMSEKHDEANVGCR